MYAYALHVTSDQLIISWAFWHVNGELWTSEVTSYELPASPEGSAATTEMPPTNSKDGGLCKKLTAGDLPSSSEGPGSPSSRAELSSALGESPPQMIPTTAVGTS